jgi:hypothetical protein
MKKLSTALLALALFASSTAMAVTKTATLVVSGTIAESCTLAVGGNGNTGNLPLTAPINGLNVGTIITQCNNFNGYSLSVDTLNASQLKSSGITPPVDYTMKFTATQGSAINTSSYFPSNSNSLDIAKISDTTEQKAVIYLSTPKGTSYPGIYSDTVTFTLQTL